MQKIKLQNATWRYDETKPLGPEGGFGEVFEGQGESGKVAVKRLKLSVANAAKREMKIGEALADKSFEHVVPVLDFGQDAESEGHFLIMPVCERSLQDYLDEQEAINPTEALGIISQIISGLIEVGDLVHRDLKPANVLFHKGGWKIADFGIAKFIEDATSLETLREGLTPLYGAPEQWRGERPSHATDVYALGCIFHTLVTGNPPFYIGDRDDVREAHLSKTPGILSEVDAKVGGFIAQMLRKSPESRPSLQRCLSVLSVAAMESEKRRASPVKPWQRSVAKSPKRKPPKKLLKKHFKRRQTLGSGLRMKRVVNCRSSEAASLTKSSRT